MNNYFNAGDWAIILLYLLGIESTVPYLAWLHVRDAVRHQACVFGPLDAVQKYDELVSAYAGRERRCQAAGERQ